AGFLAVRGDGSVTWFRIERDKDSKPVLTCSEKPRTAGAAQKCEGDFVMRGAEEDPLGEDPFAIDIFHDRNKDRDFVLAGSIDAGTVALFSIDGDSKPAFEGNTFISRGIHSIKSHPQSGDIYITSRFINMIFTAGINYKTDQKGEEPEITSGIPVAVSTVYGSSYSNADYARGIVFGSEGSRCYVSFRAPSSLLIFDTSIENGSPRNLLTGIIPLERSPAGLAVIRNGEGGSDMIYAVSFETDSVWVIDPDKMLVVDSIKVGNGPYSIVSVKRDDLNLWRAYVTNFNGHSVSVIDVDPLSPYFNNHISEIR
ncbi:MAG: hypothetical protein FJ088_15670, partial [Deltaproteobacteria bacterium]|nr:hypothetical protein [Deltaproteobacteria bacterium]